MVFFLTTTVANIVFHCSRWAISWVTPQMNFLFFVSVRCWQKQPPKAFCKKFLLKNFAISTRKHLCWSLFFKKFAGLQLATSFKRLQYRCFPVKIDKYKLNTYFKEHRERLLICWLHPLPGDSSLFLIVPTCSRWFQLALGGSSFYYLWIYPTDVLFYRLKNTALKKKKFILKWTQIDFLHVWIKTLRSASYNRVNYCL